MTVTTLTHEAGPTPGPLVLEPAHVSPEYQFAPDILSLLAVGEARTPAEPGGDTCHLVNDNENHIYAIAEGYVGGGDADVAARILGRATHDHLIQHFDPTNPEESMRDALQAGDDAILAESNKQDRSPDLDAALNIVKLFTTPSGVVKAVHGQSGGSGSIMESHAVHPTRFGFDYTYPVNKLSQNIGDDDYHVGIVNLEPDSRLAVLSRSVKRVTGPKKDRSHAYYEPFTELHPQETAQQLVTLNRSDYNKRRVPDTAAIVIDMPVESKLGFRLPLVNKLGMMAINAHIGVKSRLWDARNHIIHTRSRMADDLETSNRVIYASLGLGIAVLGLAGLYLSSKGMDLRPSGDHYWPDWAGDGDGIDCLPGNGKTPYHAESRLPGDFDGGDIHLSAFVCDDDPARPIEQLTRTTPIAPTDSAATLHAGSYDMPFQSLPEAPHVSLPVDQDSLSMSDDVVRTTSQPPQEVPAQVQEVWQPETRLINSGDGFEDIIEAQAEDMLGGADFDASAASDVFDSLIKEFDSEKIIRMTDANLQSTYTMPDGQPGLANAGYFQWYDQQIEQRLHELIMEEAAKT